MLKDFVGIKISGANFASPTSLKVFESIDSKKAKTIKGALLYGKNGSGKSTIARGFRKVAGGSVPTINQAKLLDNDDNQISLSEEDERHIFVFDEDYVDKNVKLHEDHLDTIIMLGDRADLTEKIQAAEIERDAARTAFEVQKTVYEEYCDSGSIKSPKYYILKLRFALQGDDNWAGRDKEIRGGRQNTGVRDDTYKQFQGIIPSKPKSELIIDFEEAKKELLAAKTGTTVINLSVPSLPPQYVSYNDSEIQRLLAEKIEKPELSDREKYLLQIVQQRKSQELLQRIELFKKRETTFCPYCFQKMSPEYKADLVQSIQKVLSKAVDDHQYALRERMLVGISINLSPFEKLESYNTCVELIAQIEESIRLNNDLLQQKIDDPYTPIETRMSNIHNLMFSLESSLTNLEKQREEYNKQAKRTAPIIERMTRINSEIAHYDIIELATQYDKQCKEYELAKKHYTELNESYLEKNKIVEELEAQRSKATLALDAINSCMKYIFFAEDRLKIEYVDGAYKLLSHGHSVKPCEVSIGERNIIGLCYFFTNILQGKEEKSAYSEEYVIVIDDPVSSYDVENRIGILSFLKYKLSIFLEGNINSKALVMTHDLMTFYDIYKIFEEIMEICKHNGYANPPIFNRFELKGESIKTFQYKNRQEYTELIRIVYAYGQNMADDQSLIIGNVMRQTLEAFSTFEYKKGIENVSIDEEILSSLKDRKYETYFKNLMYRLVLHGGSHKEERVKSMDDLNFFSLISDTEKKRTARDILCFIYLLNKPHLISHLKDYDSNAEITLNSWCHDIKARSVAL